MVFFSTPCAGFRTFKGLCCTHLSLYNIGVSTAHCRAFYLGFPHRPPPLRGVLSFIMEQQQKYWDYAENLSWMCILGGRAGAADILLRGKFAEDLANYLPNECGEAYRYGDGQDVFFGWKSGKLTMDGKTHSWRKVFAFVLGPVMVNAVVIESNQCAARRTRWISCRGCPALFFFLLRHQYNIVGKQSYMALDMVIRDVTDVLDCDPFSNKKTLDGLGASPVDNSCLLLTTYLLGSLETNIVISCW